ncbi:DUF4097 family beta strand repeat-containing protein [Sphaerisporangium sp. NPDC051017]|uniref:DUF4097 family beta strand repeat-containing protein n=1 Tax=Sphaerisporangium sp. NPDC051017 TaxID=3154636 RepID=UPI003422A376
MSTPTHDKGSGMPTFDTPEPISAIFAMAHATIQVEASARADTVVEIRPTDEHNDADVRTAERTEVEYADGRLVVRGENEQPGSTAGWGLSLGRLVESPASWARSLLLGPGSVEVTVGLPAGSRVDVTSAGSLRCRGPLGEVACTTSYGAIRVEQAGMLRLKSTHGDISVTRASGHAEVTTTHGGILIGRIDGTAAVKTAHGSVRIREVTGELRLNSAHGDLTVDRALAGVTAKTAYASLQIGEVTCGSVVLETNGGGLDVGIREGTAAWLDVSSTYGTVDVSLDPSDVPGGRDRTVEVRAHTTHGDILVHRS